jgi:hypothetical protein
MRLAPDQDARTAASLVLTTAISEMLARAGVTPDLRGAPEDLVIAAALLRFGAHTIAHLLAPEGVALEPDRLATGSARAVFQRLAPDKVREIVKAGERTLREIQHSAHPRAQETVQQLDAAFAVFAQTGGEKPVRALVEIYGALRRAKLG